jgi:hypothetical protein
MPLEPEALLKLHCEIVKLSSADGKVEVEK